MFHNTPVHSNNTIVSRDDQYDELLSQRWSNVLEGRKAAFEGRLLVCGWH